MSSRLIPRGIPLTESAEFTDALGVRWLAYIESLAPVRTHRLLRQTLLPGRRLRLDSAAESRVSPRLPAGAPFLSDARLKGLLAEAPLLRPPEPLIEEPWPEALGRRARAATRRGAAWYHRAATVAAEAAHAVHLAVEGLVLGRRARS